MNLTQEKDWKKKVGFPINYDSGQSSDDDFESRGVVVRRPQPSAGSLLADSGDGAEADLLGTTPPRARIRDKEKRRPIYRSNTDVEACLQRMAVDDAMRQSEESSSQPPRVPERLKKRASLKLLRAQERDWKQEQRQRESKADSLPSPSPAVPTLVESCSRFMSLSSRLKCRGEDGTGGAGDDAAGNVGGVAEDCAGGAGWRRGGGAPAPPSRVSFHSTFSMLINMGSTDKACRRTISREEQVWQNELKDLIWLGLAARVAGRSLPQQDDYLCAQRAAVPAVVRTILHYRFVNPYKCPSTDESEQDDVENESQTCLSPGCSICPESVGVAMREISSLLDAFYAVIALYPSSSAAEADQPCLAQPRLKNRIRAMCLWYNTALHMRLKMVSLRRMLRSSRASAAHRTASQRTGSKSSENHRASQVRFDLSSTPTDSTSSDASAYSDTSKPVDIRSADTRPAEKNPGPANGLSLEEKQDPADVVDGKEAAKDGIDEQTKCEGHKNCQEREDVVDSGIDSRSECMGDCTPEIIVSEDGSLHVREAGEASETGGAGGDDDPLRLGALHELAQLRLLGNTDVPLYRDYHYEMLKTQGVRRCMTFIQKICYNMLRKVYLTLLDPEEAETDPSNEDVSMKSLLNPNSEKTENKPDQIDENSYELRRYGCRCRESVDMRLPSYRSHFVLLSSMCMEAVHDYLALRLEARPAHPSCLTVKQLIHELKEGLDIATEIRCAFVRYAAAALRGEPRAERVRDGLLQLLRTFDQTVAAALQVRPCLTYNSAHTRPCGMRRCAGLLQLLRTFDQTVAAALQVRPCLTYNSAHTRPCGMRRCAGLLQLLRTFDQTVAAALQVRPCLTYNSAHTRPCGMRRCAGLLQLLRTFDQTVAAALQVRPCLTYNSAHTRPCGMRRAPACCSCCVPSTRPWPPRCRCALVSHTTQLTHVRAACGVRRPAAAAAYLRPDRGRRAAGAPLSHIQLSSHTSVRHAALRRPAAAAAYLRPDRGRRAAGAPLSHIQLSSHTSVRHAACAGLLQLLRTFDQTVAAALQVRPCLTYNSAHTRPCGMRRCAGLLQLLRTFDQTVAAALQVRPCLTYNSAHTRPCGLRRCAGLLQLLRTFDQTVAAALQLLRTFDQTVAAALQVRPCLTYNSAHTRPCGMRRCAGLLQLLRTFDQTVAAALQVRPCLTYNSAHTRPCGMRRAPACCSCCVPSTRPWPPRCRCALVSHTTQLTHVRAACGVRRPAAAAAYLRPDRGRRAAGAPLSHIQLSSHTSVRHAALRRPAAAAAYLRPDRGRRAAGAPLSHIQLSSHTSVRHAACAGLLQLLRTFDQTVAAALQVRPCLTYNSAHTRPCGMRRCAGLLQLLRTFDQTVAAALQVRSCLTYNSAHTRPCGMRRAPACCSCCVPSTRPWPPRCRCALVSHTTQLTHVRAACGVRRPAAAAAYLRPDRGRRAAGAPLSHIQLSSHTSVRHAACAGLLQLLRTFDQTVAAALQVRPCLTYNSAHTRPCGMRRAPACCSCCVPSTRPWPPRCRCALVSHTTQLTHVRAACGVRRPAAAAAYLRPDRGRRAAGAPLSHIQLSSHTSVRLRRVRDGLLQLLRTFDQTVAAALQQYLSYLSTMSETESLPRTALAAEWAFTARLAARAPRVAAHAPAAFVDIACKQLQRLVQRFDEKFASLMEIEVPNEKEESRYVVYALCRGAQQVYACEREAALQAAQAARALAARLHPRRARLRKLLCENLMRLCECVVRHTEHIFERSRLPDEPRGEARGERCERSEGARELADSMAARVRELLLQAYKLGFEVRSHTHTYAH
ncbi:unnamed protein product [Parnassius apollo]|uniref:(apollo) hypothetical protein n=1 Tax=Parnassius apollo TaxID=110799 RepID=A0A8S3XMU6_PARAO|nr:unnamed protein product [Parnassius apollo]